MPFFFPVFSTPSVLSHMSGARKRSDASNSAGIALQRLAVGLAFLCTHPQGVFVQTKRSWTLGHAYPTATCMILSERSASTIHLV